MGLTREEALALAQDAGYFGIEKIAGPSSYDDNTRNIHEVKCGERSAYHYNWQKARLVVWCRNRAVTVNSLCDADDAVMTEAVLEVYPSKVAFTDKDLKWRKSTISKAVEKHAEKWEKEYDEGSYSKEELRYWDPMDLEPALGKGPQQPMPGFSGPSTTKVSSKAAQGSADDPRPFAALNYEDWSGFQGMGLNDGPSPTSPSAFAPRKLASPTSTPGSFPRQQLDAAYPPLTDFARRSRAEGPGDVLLPGAYPSHREQDPQEVTRQVENYLGEEEPQSTASPMLYRQPDRAPYSLRGHGSLFKRSSSPETKAQAFPENVRQRKQEEQDEKLARLLQEQEREQEEQDDEELARLRNREAEAIQKMEEMEEKQAKRIKSESPGHATKSSRLSLFSSSLSPSSSSHEKKKSKGSSSDQKKKSDSSSKEKKKKSMPSADDLAEQMLQNFKKLGLEDK